MAAVRRKPQLITAQVGDAATYTRVEVLTLKDKAPGTSAPQAEAIDSINGSIRTNSCVSCSIVYRLSGTTAPMGQACAKPVRRSRGKA